MANEYLKRTPTSTGNRRVWTWSGWVKINEIDLDKYIFSSGDDASNIFYIILRRSANNNNLTILFRDGDTTSHSLVFNNNSYRDSSSWMHLVIAVNTTINTPTQDRAKVYINGTRLINPTTDELGNLTANSQTSTNALELHTIGDYSVTSGTFAKSQIFDYYLIDGQALTPDVFGFNKQGKGYISAGSAQATDFRPGQWVPKTPRVIKTEIIRRGGFGVNGFYLPMNDSSNFGADFHCDPNSIITLKGEDLPQPRNGAPTTTDAYVSQLRSDPYAANLVLAVPGINTPPTGSDLVQNGTFDSNVNSWTITDTGTIVHQSDGTAKVTRGTSAEVAYQNITTVVGTTYELSVDITDIAGSHGQVYVYSTDYSGSLDTNIGYSFYTGTFKGTFTADTTTTRIALYAHPSGSTSYDNISVKATTIRDYSADIKGSGTNKTLAVNGDAGIRTINDTSGSAVGGYYGSALTFDGTNDYFTTPNSSDFYFNGDFTVEA
jgi:hypothetical protein